MKFIQLAFRDLQSALTVLCGLFLLGSFLPGLQVLAVAAVASGSYFAFLSAWDSLQRRVFDVNLLMVLAAAGAVSIGQVQDAAALLFLFSLSSTMEAFAMAKTKSAIAGLVKLRPSQALRVTSDGEEKVPVESLKVGDLVRISPFEGFPIDGMVVEGESSADESSMTGESVSVQKGPDDRVTGGTQNLDGILLVKVGAVIGDSTLDRIVNLVADAQENKASGERISTWFGERYTVFVVACFVGSFLVRILLHQPSKDAFYSALTLLVGMSPCALVISIPASTLSALAWAARNGILVRGGEFIEEAGFINAVALDKTGTITSGKPVLREIVTLDRMTVPPDALGNVGTSRWESGETLSDQAAAALATAASVDRYATHPLAQAIEAAATSLGLAIPEATDHRTVPGLGVTAQLNGVTSAVGKEDLLIASGHKVPEALAKEISKLERSGHSLTLVGGPEGVSIFAFSDQIRTEAAPFIQKLRQLGIRRIAMVTGDRSETAREVASAVGIEEFHAGLMPDQKTERIQEMSKASRVLMVGDGVNDAPSLALASVGVAMGGLGSDIALSAADVVLMQDRLDRIPDLIRLGRRTNGIIRANLIFAGAMIVVLTISSLLIRLPLPIAVLGHEGSTVLVILNGLRLLKGPTSQSPR